MAGLIRGQKCGYLRDLVRVSHPSERNTFCKIFFHLYERIALLKPFENWSIDMPRADRVYANMTPAEFIRPRSCEGPDSCLGRAVHTNGRETLGCCYRGI